MASEQPDEVELVDQEGFTVVGVTVSEPPFILYGWGALAARRHDIEHIIDPHLTYGVWYRTADHQGTGNNACILGFRVEHADSVPEGLAALTVPPCRCAVFEHRGHIGTIGRTYERIHEWFQDRFDFSSEADAPPVGAIEIYDTSQELTGDYVFKILEAIPGEQRPT